MTQNNNYSSNHSMVINLVAIVRWIRFMGTSTATSPVKSMNPYNLRWEDHGTGSTTGPFFCLKINALPCTSCHLKHNLHGTILRILIYMFQFYPRQKPRIVICYQCYISTVIGRNWDTRVEEVLATVVCICVQRRLNVLHCPGRECNKLTLWSDEGGLHGENSRSDQGEIIVPPWMW